MTPGHNFVPVGWTRIVRSSPTKGLSVGFGPGQDEGGIVMAVMATSQEAATRDPMLRLGSWLMGLAAVGFLGYAVIFFIRNFTDSFLELGIGPGEVNVGKDQIQAFSPSLFQYISHLHIAVAGFIAAAAVAVLFLVVYGVRKAQLWAWVGAVATPVLGLAVALPAHYPNHFDTLGHLGLIYLAVLIFVAGALLALRGIMDTRRR